jgi:signal recognition particle receptor subunit beta
MAILDPTSNEIVIRVVYDGPPEAGKTTSVRALAASLGQRSQTPVENAEGRTQWFDWMEYVGGRFEGSQIRCQIVSVPGQRALGKRRRALLDSADVIVFVGDTTAGRWEMTLEYLAELHGRVGTGDAPLGVVFQANKRDVAGAVEIAEIRRQLGEARWEIGIVESVAADGTGIREAFVYAVRLALDRIRELSARGALREGKPDDVSPMELLTRLRAHDAPRLVGPARVDSNPKSLAAQLLEGVLAAEIDGAPPLPPIPAAPRHRLVAPGSPRPPDASVPSGAIWPPVEGRAILLEVSQLELAPRRHANGDWSAGLGSGWRLVSKREALFESLDGGRNALVQWARLHASCTGVVSPHRCIVLAATGDGTWRLWQIVRAEESLRDQFQRATSELPPQEVADRLCETAQLLVEVNEKLSRAPCELTCSLDTIGACDASGMYIGLMPDVPTEPRKLRLSAAALVISELGPMIALDLAGVRDDLGRALQGKPKPLGPDDAVIASIRRMLE